MPCPEFTIPCSLLPEGLPNLTNYFPAYRKSPSSALITGGHIGVLRIIPFILTLSSVSGSFAG
ncbi:MAG TPA: hypothetical protein VNE41_03525 [Chitinophagaceae bacterium]|nr:hypothetical protein [Chitinophagaceae bacterium]